MCVVPTTRDLRGVSRKLKLEKVHEMEGKTTKYVCFPGSNLVNVRTSYGLSPSYLSFQVPFTSDDVIEIMYAVLQTRNRSILNARNVKYPFSNGSCRRLRT